MGLMFSDDCFYKNNDYINVKDEYNRILYQGIFSERPLCLLKLPRTRIEKVKMKEYFSEKNHENNDKIHVNLGCGYMTHEPPKIYNIISSNKS